MSIALTPSREAQAPSHFGRANTATAAAVPHMALPRPSAHRDVRRRAAGMHFRRVSGGPCEVRPLPPRHQTGQSETRRERLAVLWRAARFPTLHALTGA